MSYIKASCTWNCCIMSVTCVRTCPGDWRGSALFRGATRLGIRAARLAIGYPSTRPPLVSTGSEPNRFDPSLASDMATVDQQVAQAEWMCPCPAVRPPRRPYIGTRPYPVVGRAGVSSTRHEKDLCHAGMSQPDCLFNPSHL
jgi:hypothetical protein